MAKRPLSPTQQAELYRLAQATAILRLMREHGIEPEHPEEGSRWWQDGHVIATCPTCSRNGVVLDEQRRVVPIDSDVAEARRSVLRRRR
jgi:hypothetical protein